VQLEGAGGIGSRENCSWCLLVVLLLVLLVRWHGVCYIRGVLHHRSRHAPAKAQAQGEGCCASASRTASKRVIAHLIQLSEFPQS
jgi:hypothetical protein